MEKLEKYDFVLCREHLYRIFNGSWRTGGRFYGPTYQGFPKDIRRHIYIDDETVIERDYRAMHLSLALNQAGYKVTEDPYLRLIDGNSEFREDFKLVGYVVLYCSSRKQATQAINDAIIKKRLSLPEGMTTKDALDRFVEVFPELRDLMFKGIGLMLPFQDSQILNHIIKRLIGKGILPLTIHDSVIVQEKYTEELEQAMNEEDEKVMGFEPIIN